MNNKDYVIQQANAHIVDVPDFPKPGIIFKDITPVFEDAKYSKAVIDAMLEECQANGMEFDKIIAMESRGFLFGAPMSVASGKGLVLARKPGKLPREGVSASYELEYGSETVFVSKGSIQKGERVLIVDDLLATGGTAKAAAEIIEKCGGTVAGCAFYIELTPLKGVEKLKEYKNFSLVKVEAY